MVGTKLCLQLGGAIGLVHPGGAAHAAHAVDDAEVELPALHEEHGHAEAQVPGADDHLGVLVHVGQPLEGADALHNHVAAHLLVRVHQPEHGAALLHELDVVGAYGELEGQHLRHLQDHGARHAGHHLLLAGVRDLQRHGDPGRAALPMLLALDGLVPVLVVAHGLRPRLLAGLDGPEALVPGKAGLGHTHAQRPVWVVLQVLGPFRVEVLRRHGPPHGTAKQQCPGPERGNGLEA
mmetsp:Transcript_34323/g.103436  ORF Transcript_34323/g.103436 Transcript_34323/m.103436 type:complete len:236 (+) Transcript_34323:1587-2294(+)